MVKHIIMWKLYDFAEGFSKEENAQRMKQQLEELAACRREAILLRKVPLKHGSKLELGSHAPLLLQKAADLGMAFFTPTGC